MTRCVCVYAGGRFIQLLLPGLKLSQALGPLFRERTRTRGQAETRRSTEEARCAIHQRYASRRIPRLCPVPHRALPRPGRCAAAKRKEGKPCHGFGRCAAVAAVRRGKGKALPRPRRRATIEKLEESYLRRLLRSSAFIRGRQRQVGAVRVCRHRRAPRC
ncbi:hypothetical protein NDU88_002838 [Pleurodeles waltl]|uniref:Uncharacterized protein n=1 Tax=Pleurodeles waltl TaxID=8319 RepID=A0AAV7T3J5_PLEWA|nr:hypothetical protein NDU88_002838 [Pleurodeles waltl]